MDMVETEKEAGKWPPVLQQKDTIECQEILLHRSLNTCSWDVAPSVEILPRMHKLLGILITA